MTHPNREELAGRTCHCSGVAFGSYEAQVELVPPDFLRREDGRGICVDVCLALEVTQLWGQGIRTTGCCCGHGRLEPTICVASESVKAMFALGYVNTPLLLGRDDAFTAKTGWPAAALRQSPSVEEVARVIDPTLEGVDLSGPCAPKSRIGRALVLAQAIASLYRGEG